MRVDFYWDVGSTNTYFALHLIRPIVERHAAELVMYPFNLGFVFRHHRYALADEPRAKIANRLRDLERWAARHALPFRMPDAFPIKTAAALRGAIAARKWDQERAYVDEIFRRYWQENDASIAKATGLESVARAIGVDPALFLAECDSKRVREVLIESTSRGLERGVFGAPSFFVGDELYWGKDRMEFIEDALAKA